MPLSSWETIRVLIMRKWKTYIAEALPLAIVVGFLAVIAINPEISRPSAEDPFEYLIKEYFMGDTLTQENIPTLLEQFSHVRLNRADGEPPSSVLPPDVADSSRTRIRTTVDITMNFNGSLSEKEDLQTQIAAMREHGFEEIVYYEMMEE